MPSCWTSFEHCFCQELACSDADLISLLSCFNFTVLVQVMETECKTCFQHSVKLSKASVLNDNWPGKQSSFVHKLFGNKGNVKWSWHFTVGWCTLWRSLRWNTSSQLAGSGCDRTVPAQLQATLLGSLMLGLCLGFGWFFSLHSCWINRLLLLCREAADVLRFSFDPSLDVFLNRDSVVELKAKQMYCASK